MLPRSKKSVRVKQTYTWSDKVRAVHGYFDGWRSVVGGIEAPAARLPDDFR